MVEARKLTLSVSLSTVRVYSAVSGSKVGSRVPALNSRPDSLAS